MFKIEIIGAKIMIQWNRLKSIDFNTIEFDRIKLFESSIILWTRESHSLNLQCSDNFRENLNNPDRIDSLENDKEATVVVQGLETNQNISLDDNNNNCTRNDNLCDRDERVEMKSINNGGEEDSNTRSQQNEQSNRMLEIDQSSVLNLPSDESDQSKISITQEERDDSQQIKIIPSLSLSNFNEDVQQSNNKRSMRFKYSTKSLKKHHRSFKNFLKRTTNHSSSTPISSCDSSDVLNNPHKSDPSRPFSEVRIMVNDDDADAVGHIQQSSMIECDLNRKSYLARKRFDERENNNNSDEWLPEIPFQNITDLSYSINEDCQFDPSEIVLDATQCDKFGLNQSKQSPKRSSIESADNLNRKPSLSSLKNTHLLEQQTVLGNSQPTAAVLSSVSTSIRKASSRHRNITVSAQPTSPQKNLSKLSANTLKTVIRIDNDEISSEATTNIEASDSQITAPDAESTRSLNYDTATIVSAIPSTNIDLKEKFERKKFFAQNFLKNFVHFASFDKHSDRCDELRTDPSKCPLSTATSSSNTTAIATPTSTINLNQSISANTASTMMMMNNTKEHLDSNLSDCNENHSDNFSNLKSKNFVANQTEKVGKKFGSGRSQSILIKPTLTMNQQIDEYIDQFIEIDTNRKLFQENVNWFLLNFRSSDYERMVSAVLFIHRNDSGSIYIPIHILSSTIR
ncbi:innexin [Sarcoptes scabiei]|nr:innexin [Sarcoptes scabiei]